MLLLQVYREEGSIQSVLEDRLCVDWAVVTRTVQSLEKKGLVFRERDGTDSRKKHVYLTEEGKKRWPFFQSMIIHLGEYFEKGLSSEDIEAARIIDTLASRVVRADSSIL
jgi:DNA-binding MarR family transcriptional regulator